MSLCYITARGKCLSLYLVFNRIEESRFFHFLFLRRYGLQCYAQDGKIQIRWWSRRPAFTWRLSARAAKCMDVISRIVGAKWISIRIDTGGLIVYWYNDSRCRKMTIWPPWESSQGGFLLGMKLNWLSVRLITGWLQVRFLPLPLAAKANTI